MNPRQSIIKKRTTYLSILFFIVFTGFNRFYAESEPLLLAPVTIALDSGADEKTEGQFRITELLTEAIIDNAGDFDI